MTKTFKTNERCHVKIDWADNDVYNVIVQVIGAQGNGNMTFYRVKWLGCNADTLGTKYGNLFTSQELTRVKV